MIRILSLYHHDGDNIVATVITVITEVFRDLRRNFRDAKNWKNIFFNYVKISRIAIIILFISKNV